MTDDRARIDELPPADVAFRDDLADAVDADERPAPDQRGAARGEDLSRRLRLLPPGHPSSPYDADGSRKPPAPRLRDFELPDDQPADPTDSVGEIRRLTDEEHVEHATEVRARLDKARADGLSTDHQYTIDPKRQS